MFVFLDEPCQPQCGFENVECIRSEAEIKQLRGTRESYASGDQGLSPKYVIQASNVSKDGKIALHCKCCGELTFVMMEEESSSPKGVAQQDKDVRKSTAVEMMKVHGKNSEMEAEIKELKDALNLALQAEQQTRKEAGCFTMASRQACETLQDRISAQLIWLSDAEAEKAMALAQYNLESAKVC